MEGDGWLVLEDESPNAGKEGVWLVEEEWLDAEERGGWLVKEWLEAEEGGGWLVEEWLETEEGEGWRAVEEEDQLRAEEGGG